MAQPTPGIRAHQTAWEDVILVCRKCSKKLQGGFGPNRDLTLARALKQSLRTTDRRRTTQIVETKCLGLCPKNAVTILSASVPGTLLAAAAGTSTADILARLPPPPQPPAPPPPRTAAPAAGS